MRVIDQAGTFFTLFRSLSNEKPSRTILVQQDANKETVDILAYQGSLGLGYLGWHHPGRGDWADIDDILDYYGLTEIPIRQ